MTTNNQQKETLVDAIIKTTIMTLFPSTFTVLAFITWHLYIDLTNDADAHTDAISVLKDEVASLKAKVDYYSQSNVKQWETINGLKEEIKELEMDHLKMPPLLPQIPKVETKPSAEPQQQQLVDPKDLFKNIEESKSSIDWKIKQK